MNTDSEKTRRVRERHFGRGLSLSYREPLTILRGEGQYLFTDTGERYLDCVNNVCHVGHGHPHVVQAAYEQMRKLNTNTRYLHPKLADYLEALVAKFPAPLKVVYLVCSGSEAVDLALRLAYTATRARDIVVLESGYHGHTIGTIGASHYKYAGPGGEGQPVHTRAAPLPCDFRGPYRRGDPDLASKYAATVIDELRAIEEQGRRPAAFLCESMVSVGGQIVPPSGYLSEVYAAVRAAGALCIADEVQVGFGRCGETFWAFERDGVVPDIVTLGKPIGNGHPLAAVVTTPEISAAFDNGMEYFNTFGGNPVSCAVGLAVLEVIEHKGLQANAFEVGAKLLAGFGKLASSFPILGDVRGKGLFLGMELVRNRETLEPADREASAVVEALKRRRILMSVDGPLHNVIKLKPPMVFSTADADRLLEALGESFAEL